MVTRRIGPVGARCCRSVLSIFAVCGLLALASCGPAGPPPTNASLQVNLDIHSIGQTGIPCTAPCPMPAITISGNTSAAAASGNFSCFRTATFGTTLAPPSCANTPSAVSEMWGNIGTTASGYIVNAFGSSLQPGTWTITLKSSQTNVIPNASCTVAFVVGLHSLDMSTCQVI
jgi:hypothetical protein